MKKLDDSFNGDYWSSPSRTRRKGSSKSSLADGVADDVADPSDGRVGQQSGGSSPDESSGSPKEVIYGTSYAAVSIWRVIDSFDGEYWSKLPKRKPPTYRSKRAASSAHTGSQSPSPSPPIDEDDGEGVDDDAIEDVDQGVIGDDVGSSDSSSLAVSGKTDNNKRRRKSSDAIRLTSEFDGGYWNTLSDSGKRRRRSLQEKPSQETSSVTKRKGGSRVGASSKGKQKEDPEDTMEGAEGAAPSLDPSGEELMVGGEGDDDDGDDDDDDDDGSLDGLDEALDVVFSAENPIGVKSTLDGAFWNNIGSERSRSKRKQLTYSEDHIKRYTSTKWRKRLTSEEKDVLRARAAAYADMKRALNAKERARRAEVAEQALLYESSCRQIMPHLYVSSHFVFVLNPTPLDQIEALGITHVVNATKRKFPYEALARDQGIKVTRVPVEDAGRCAADIARHFSSITRLVDEERAKGGRTLIHCVLGKSRSPCLCVAYLVGSQGFSLQSAYDHVRKVNWGVNINHGFIRALMKYEQHVRGVEESSLVEYERPVRRAKKTQGRS